MNKYAEDHPLYGRDAEWIEKMARDAMRSIDEHTPTSIACYSTANLLALAHERKRFKADAEKLKDKPEACENVRETWDELHRLRREIIDLAKEAGLGDGMESACFAITRMTFEFRRLRGEESRLKSELSASHRKQEDAGELDGHRKNIILNSRAPEGSGWHEILEHINEVWVSRRSIIQERDTLKAAQPPPDWLTRAIELSGAPEGSDWAGLLEYIDKLYQKEQATHLDMRDWKKSAEEAHKGRKESEAKAEAIRREIAAMHDHTRCLLATAEVAEEGPTPYSYAWPAPELGGLHALAVPYRVIRELAEERDRLRERSDKVSDACAKALNQVDELDGEVRKLRERAEAAEACQGYIQAQTIAEMLDLKPGRMLVEAARERIAELKAAESKVEELEGGQILNRKAIERKDAAIKKLEAQVAGLEHAKHERANAKAAEWVSQTSQDDVHAMETSKLRIKLGDSETQVAKLEAEIVQHVSGADFLRHNAGLTVNPITSEVQDGRWVNTISKSRWDGKAWESIGMVNGWIGSFDGELPDCVADSCERRAPPPLERIAAALEKRNEGLFSDKSAPMIHTQHGGRFDVEIT